MNTKRILIIMLSVILVVSMFTFSASAANTTDVDFVINIGSSPSPNTASSARLKTNSSSSYINYNTTTSGAAATGPYKFEALIYGSAYSTQGFTDCSSYTWDGYARTKAIVTRGTVGLIRQDVYEIYGPNSYAQIYGKSCGYTGTAKGCWSADSIGSYSYYNAVA